MGDVWVMAHTEDRLTISQTLVTAAIQLWLTPRLWVKGGVGAAHASYDWDGGLVQLSDRSDDVPGFMVAAGYELASRPTFAIDLQLRYGTGLYSTDGNDEEYEIAAHNASVSIGLNWY